MFAVEILKTGSPVIMEGSFFNRKDCFFTTQDWEHIINN